MSVKIPDNYKLEPFTDRKVLRSRKYQPWTVGDLKEFIADFPEDATVWVTRYDVAEDELYIHPMEHLGGCRSDAKGESYITI